MDGISSTPIENSVEFLRLRDKYKSDLFEDTRLNKAAGLAAKQELLLESPAPDTWKEPRLKAVNRELQQWVKKIRQPGGTRGITRDQDGSDDEDDNLAVAPIHKMMGHISKLRQGIKRKAEPVTPLLQTPVIKQPPSTGKKPKLSFKTGSKAKTWVLKPSKKKPLSGYKTFPKVKSPSPPSSMFSTADEEVPLGTAYGETPLTTAYGGLPPDDGYRFSTTAEHPPSTAADEGDPLNVFGEEDTFTTGTEVPAISPLQQSLEEFKRSIERKKEMSQRITRARERALKKLAPAPGWKPFGTPTKRMTMIE